MQSKDSFGLNVQPPVALTTRPETSHSQPHRLVQLSRPGRRSHVVSGQGLVVGQHGQVGQFVVVQDGVKGRF